MSRLKKSHHNKILSPSTQDLAKNSRMHSGERLIKRGMRYDVDKAAPSMIEGTIGTSMHDGEMVIKIINKVKPSLNQGLHNPKVCFNAKLCCAHCYCNFICLPLCASDIIITNNISLC